jgi:beta-galactosidase/beta-glucuronidase
MLPVATWILAMSQTTAQPAPAPTHSLVTRWAKDVSPTNPLPEYPRPQMARRRWQSLNGPWSYGTTDLEATEPPAKMDGRILVPFPYESRLSGSQKPSIPHEKLWYRRTFTVPTAWKGRHIMLNFGAVNYESRVIVNGKTVGGHVGGYDAFSYDITSVLREGDNELVVSAVNPLRADVPDAQVLGKQRIHPESIFYTGCTGIWQTVWLEPVPAAHIESIRMNPSVDHSSVTVSAIRAGDETMKVTVFDGGKEIASGVSRQPLNDVILHIPDAKLWTPESPFLYDVRVELGDDRITSYFGMRKISLGKDAEGHTTICLNNRPYFQVGPLDQGYWPDGIYTAPTDAALKSDIVATKKFGFNMIRKHAKVEPARWYYHADKLGVLVWQDMPQMFGGKNDSLTSESIQQFQHEWGRIIAQHINSPSIVIWTPFNEGWGQHDTPEVVRFTHAQDPSRLINNASGWTDKGVGDINDVHAYPGPGSNMPEEHRAAVNGEFGGVTLSVPGHRWTENVMGYGATLDSGKVATDRYVELLRAAYALKASHGTCAFVYTQLTDVEQEINGLLTYDRSVTKLNAKAVAAANRGEFSK